MNKQKEILLITALPFKRQGNQSLLRFVKMLTDNGNTVHMYTSGNDSNGENALGTDLLSVQRFFSIGTSYFSRVKIGKVKQTKSNYYKVLKSEDILLPFGNESIKTLLSKWVLYLLTLIDNVIFLSYFYLKEKETKNKYECVLGYECGYTLSARILSKLLKVPYINKFQGTVLKASNRNSATILKYFPSAYFGINASDLCLMVDDGTDGEYYAKVRGCKNIYFQNHGVNDKEYENVLKTNLYSLKEFEGKFILFNNASTSKWKRTDRTIRPLKLLDKSVLDKVILITTYSAPDKEALKSWVDSIGLSNNVFFLEGADHLVSNYLIQKCHLLTMTNDMSNLGNPVLEAIFYGTPILSINHNSFGSRVQNGKNAILIDLDSDFDKNYANAVTRCIEDGSYYNSLKKAAMENHSVQTLKDQQIKEMDIIEAAMEEYENRKHIK